MLISMITFAEKHFYKPNRRKGKRKMSKLCEIASKQEETD